MCRDGDRRRQTINPFGRRLFQAFLKLPRVRGKAFDVSPLALGVKRIESEAALAAATEPTKHDKPSARQIEVDLLEVMNLDFAELNTRVGQACTLR